MIKAMFSGIVQCWYVGMGAFGGFVINLMMSSFEARDEESILRPQPTIVHNALAKGHWKNKWVYVSSSELHKLQVVSDCWILCWRFTFVGMALAPILHKSILRRSGSLDFHKSFQWDWEWSLLLGLWKTTLWTDLTKKFHLGLGSHISLSCLVVIGIGIGIVRIASAESEAKISLIIFASQVFEDESKRWWALKGSCEHTSILGWGLNTSIHGIHGSSQTLIDLPSPRR